MENKTITMLHYNWIPALSNGIDIYSEQFTSAEVGRSECISIIEHKAMGEGDRWYYDVNYNDGRTIRVFNPNCVVFTPSVTESPKQL
jgi:hypothetical protein